MIYGLGRGRSRRYCHCRGNRRPDQSRCTPRPGNSMICRVFKGQVCRCLIKLSGGDTDDDVNVSNRHLRLL